ncbi:MAG: orotidine-5'-phosphate decarboxylase [Gemmatimonadaceae bacterium]|nr:orotidine-5'-phosphate decarboxylase [Gemmatimonadaceae bacterium]
MSAIPIVALDVPTLADAQALVTRLGASADFYKVGLELFTAEGPPVVRWLRAAGKRVFLDLKLHDIPNTVRGAAASAARLDVQLLTVHGGGGEVMVRAAVDGAGERTGILAVTVLTSFDAAALAAASGRADIAVPGEVMRLAGIARAAAAHGIVCSGEEVAAVRAAHGDALAPLVPGIRFADGDAHDQRRVVTPAEGQRRGARYLILGRAVTGASDPAAAMARVHEELAAP